MTPGRVDTLLLKERITFEEWFEITNRGRSDLMRHNECFRKMSDDDVARAAKVLLQMLDTPDIRNLPKRVTYPALWGLANVLAERLDASVMREALRHIP